MCFCCEKDENGNYINEPCCGHSGICDAGNTDNDYSMCECCGAEMFKENNFWFHWSQREIPFNERMTKHFGK